MKQDILIYSPATSPAPGILFSRLSKETARMLSAKSFTPISIVPFRPISTTTLYSEPVVNFFPASWRLFTMRVSSSSRIVRFAFRVFPATSVWACRGGGEEESGSNGFFTLQRLDFSSTLETINSYQI